MFVLRLKERPIQRPELLIRSGTTPVTVELFQPEQLNHEPLLDYTSQAKTLIQQPFKCKQPPKPDGCLTRHNPTHTTILCESSKGHFT